jgi:hypothetical protein
MVEVEEDKVDVSRDAAELLLEPCKLLADYSVASRIKRDHKNVSGASGIPTTTAEIRESS